jgi:hypothetical protein
MIMYCPVCLAAMRVKVDALKAIPRGNYKPCIKQIVLPPVAAWER